MEEQEFYLLTFFLFFFKSYIPDTIYLVSIYVHIFMRVKVNEGAEYYSALVYGGVED